MARNLFSQGAFCKRGTDQISLGAASGVGAGTATGAGTGTGVGTGMGAGAAREVYLLLIVLWHLGETACNQPDLGPSQLHPIAIYQYQSFSAKHGQL
jgi:hypothetical protein